MVIKQVFQSKQLTFIENSFILCDSLCFQRGIFIQWGHHDMKIYPLHRQTCHIFCIFEEPTKIILHIHLQPLPLPLPIPQSPLRPRRHTLLQRLISPGKPAPRGNPTPPSQPNFVSLTLNPTLSAILTSRTSVIAAPPPPLAGPTCVVGAGRHTAWRGVV